MAGGAGQGCGHGPSSAFGPQCTFAFLLGQPTPDAVGLLDLQRMFPAPGQDGTAVAHRFGLRHPAAPILTALKVGMEERGGLQPTTRPRLPPPMIVNGSGKPTHICHAYSLG